MRGMAWLDMAAFDGGELANGGRHRTGAELGLRGVGKQAGNNIWTRVESRIKWRQQRVRGRPESSGASRSDGGRSGSSAGPVLGTTRGRGRVPQAWWLTVKP